MCKKNKCNIFAIIGIVVAIASAMAVAAYFIYRCLNKHCLCGKDYDECYEFDCADCDAEDCLNCPLTENLAEEDNGEEE